MSLSAANPRAPDLSGTALDGRYELEAVIGEGSFGRVYRGRDRRLSRLVAIKVIKPWWAEDPDWVSRFEREAQLMASVSDPRIVQIFDVGEAEEGPYYVAELVAGESIAARLRRGALPAGEARGLAEQLARALGSAHAQRVVHGDVKPANVLITPGGAVKVTDFGLARLLGGSSGHVAATTAGTPTYMAPEQVRGRGTTPATDVYSIGVMLYEMLTGHAPFRGSSPIELALGHLQDHPPPLPTSVPADLVVVVERALAKHPEERYRNGGELAGALELEPLAARATWSPLRPRSGASSAEPRRTGVAKTLVAPWRGPRRDVNPAGRRRTIAAFGLVFLVLAGMIAGAILTGGARVRVPDLRGLTRPALVAKLSRAHLRVRIRSRYSPAQSGTVIAQAPGAGTRVAQGSRVRATLSAGPAPVSVPRVVGFSSADAESSLQQLGLRVGVNQVPAPGVATGTVVAQYPTPRGELRPGSTVSVSVAEAPRWRTVLSLIDQGGQASFDIRGNRWRIVYDMAYDGTCTFIFFCSGPTARVLNLGRGTTVSSFDLNEGSNQVRTIHDGPGTYQVKIAPGDDSASWSARIQDYY